MTNRTSPASCVRDTVLTLGSIGVKCMAKKKKKEKKKKTKMINANNIYLKEGALRSNLSLGYPLIVQIERVLMEINYTVDEKRNKCLTLP